MPLSLSSLVRIDGTLNRGRDISVVLRPVILPFNAALRNATFQQNTSLPHVASIVWNFLKENFRILLWPKRFPFILSMENIVCKLLQSVNCHHMPSTTVGELTLYEQL